MSLAGLSGSLISTSLICTLLKFAKADLSPSGKESNFCFRINANKEGAPFWLKLRYLKTLEPCLLYKEKKVNLAKFAIKPTFFSFSLILHHWRTQVTL